MSYDRGCSDIEGFYSFRTLDMVLHKYVENTETKQYRSNETILLNAYKRGNILPTLYRFTLQWKFNFN